MKGILEYSDKIDQMRSRKPEDKGLKNIAAELRADIENWNSKINQDS